LKETPNNVKTNETTKRNNKTKQQNETTKRNNKTKQQNETTKRNKKEKTKPFSSLERETAKESSQQKGEKKKHTLVRIFLRGDSSERGKSNALI